MTLILEHYKIYPYSTTFQVPDKDFLDLGTNNNVISSLEDEYIGVPYAVSRTIGD